MAKLTLNTIVAGYKATTALNSNSAATATAMEKTLSRDGTGPNTMTADLDMNGNSILNSANALGAVTSISVTAPITKSGTSTPTIAISASTGSAAGSMSAADKTKLNAISGTNTGDQTTVSGNAGTATLATNVTTNANLTGHITSSGNAAVLGSFSSAQLKAALSDESGSGAAVFAESPSLVTPALGTPASGVATNLTGTASNLTAGTVTTNANLTGHITSSGNAAVLGSFTSAQLATALTNETGSGAAVFGTSPSIASPTMTGTVTVPTPNNNTDAATKAYVDTIKQGSIDIKDSVRLASTANIAIGSALTNGSTIDGATAATGNRVLLKNQSDASENGIYVVVGSGTASRSTDANSSALVTNGMYTFVSEGSVSNATGYVLTTVDPINLDTTNLTFTQFSGAGQIDAGAGLTKTGNTLNVIGTAGRIVANANTVDIGSAVALVASPLSQFAATSSTQLKGVLSDETGSGSVVFATSPTLVTPVLGVAAATSIAVGASAILAKNHTLGAGTAVVAGGSDGAAEAIIEGANIPLTNSFGNLNIISNTAQAANTGGQIAFAGKSTDSNNKYATWAVIKGAKENATTGNIASYLAFSTRADGAGNTEKMRITSGGDLTLSSGAVNQTVHTEAAHATTSDIWTGGNTCLLSGSAVTFTDIANAPQAGAVRFVVANAAHIITDNANLEVDGSANYTCAANDVLMFTAKTTSAFRVNIIAHGDTATGGGGGATGGGTDAVFNENSLIVTTDYTLTTGKSANSVGPITINSGRTVTIPSGARWVIL